MRFLTALLALAATALLAGCGMEGYPPPSAVYVPGEPMVAHAYAPAFESNPPPLFRWQHVNARPYAHSREEAMRRRARAFQQLGFPSPVAELFLEATGQPGRTVYLRNGNRLAGMLSAGDVLHRNVLVDVGAPFALQGIPAEVWQVECAGVIYTLVLPAPCYNWSAAPPCVLDAPPAW